MRPPMFHLRFARSLERTTAKTPQAAPSQRRPKRRTKRTNVGGVPPQIPKGCETS